MASPTTQPSATVYLASFAALLGALSMGLGLGYSAPALPGIKNDTKIITDPTEADGQGDVFASMLAIGALVGGMLCEPSNKFFGRRLSLILFGAPFSVGWLLIAIAPNFTVLIIGRLLTGLCCGLISGVAPSYVVEIATPSIRGLLGTSFQVLVVIGILIAAVLGLFLDWRGIAATSVTASVLMSSLMFFMPETPQWLLSKQRQDEAEASLKRLRSSAINDEFAVLQQTSAQSAQSGSQYSIATLTSREFCIPFVLALGLMFFQQFSGINAVLFYQTDIFKQAAPSIDPLMATIYACIAQVIATMAGSLLVDRLGRKVLLFASGMGHVVSLTIFGFFNYYAAKDPNFSQANAWIPLFSIIVFISSFSIGFGPIPWMMIPEISSARVRSVVASIATAFNWTCVYIVTSTVNLIISSAGRDWTYWIFAIICAFACVFVVLALPETKGRTSEQIQRELLGYVVGSDTGRAGDGASGQLSNQQAGSQLKALA